MPDLTSTRAKEFLTAHRSVTTVQDMAMTNRGLAAAHEHVPGSDQAFPDDRNSMAPARKAYGSGLLELIIDAEVHQVPETVRYSNGRRTFSTTRNLVPVACVPENPPSGISGSNLNEVAQ